MPIPDQNKTQFQMEMEEAEGRRDQGRPLRAGSGPGSVDAHRWRPFEWVRESLWEEAEPPLGLIIKPPGKTSLQEAF